MLLSAKPGASEGAGEGMEGIFGGGDEAAGVLAKEEEARTTEVETAVGVGLGLHGDQM